MKTILHIKTYHLRNEGDAREYRELNDKLSGMGLERMEFGRVSGGDGFKCDLFKLDGKEVELETEFLFDNQWNTAPVEGLSETGFRVFDWSDSHIWGVDKVRTVQWLEQTDEMRAIRADRHKCGYCANMVPKAEVPADGFCNKCLDSEYLKRDDLHLLRMLPVSSKDRRQPLSEAEEAALVPVYIGAQVHGNTERGIKRAAKRRQEALDKHKKAVENAEVELNGTMWLLDNLPQADPIYYTHTGRWGFGWRNPLDKGVASQLREILDRKVNPFPFAYDIKEHS